MVLLALLASTVIYSALAACMGMGFHTILGCITAIAIAEMYRDKPIKRKIR